MSECPESRVCGDELVCSGQGGSCQRAILYCRGTLLSGDKCFHCTPHKVVVVVSSFHLSPRPRAFPLTYDHCPRSCMCTCTAVSPLLIAYIILLGGWMASRFFCGHYTPILLSHCECGNELIAARTNLP
jgi:hypothetical protein